MYGNTGNSNITIQDGYSRVDEVVVAPAPAEADSGDVATITLKEPFALNGKRYETLRFDFGKLGFADIEMMEMDMTSKGMAVMKNAFLSDVYCMYVAAMACGININDLKKHLGFKDCFRVIGAARNFLKDADSDQAENSATR